MNKITATILLKTVMSILILALLFTRIEIGEVTGRIELVGTVGIAITTTVLFVLTFAMALRWRSILTHSGENLSYIKIWQIVVLGTFFNQVLPSGIGGDAFRIWYANRAGVSAVVAASSVVTDRFLALLTLVILVLMGIPYFLTLHIESWLALATLMVLLMIAAGVVFVLSLDKIITMFMKKYMVKPVKPRWDFLIRLKNTLEKMSVNVRSFFSHSNQAIVTLAISLTIFIVIGMLVYILGRLMGARLELLPAILLTPPALLLSMVPISLAGWGVREVAMIVFFGLVGVSVEAALGISICLGLCTILASIPGVWFWIVERHAMHSDEGIKHGQGN